jgi:hypothetical protein
MGSSKENRRRRRLECQSSQIGFFSSVQGCQILLGTTYLNEEECTKLTQKFYFQTKNAHFGIFWKA